MCGICGIMGPAAAQGVNEMVAAMDHRGPDDSGLFRDNELVLGHTRLAIIDRSMGGHQPMSNADGSVWIIYNGEAYNFHEEREWLKKRGHRFSTASDTEVVLRLYEEHGQKFLGRLRGMFALAIYDRRPPRPRLLLARDPFGIKPLLYSQIGRSLVFASELKALFASGLVERRIDPVALRLLLVHGSVPQPMSIVAGVQSLLPGHLLTYEGGAMRIERYWSLDTNRYAAIKAQAYPEMVQALRSVLEESVRLQMVSDVPIGAFLSGGVDSGITAALMARLGGKRLKTFSVGFSVEGSSIDETSAAQRLANHIGSDHTRVLVTGRDLLNQLMASMPILSRRRRVNRYALLFPEREATNCLRDILGTLKWSASASFNENRNFALVNSNE
jgi:asparagine synthase (glutamine-hydrolysing)